MRKLWKIAAKLAGALLAALAVAAAVLTLAGGRDRLVEAETAVVFGNEVLADGRPSPRLAARLDRALGLYRAGLVKTVIVSGGEGQSGWDEASVMAAWLEGRGVPAEALVLDHEGFNSWRTAVFTAAYLKEHGQDGVIAVSQDFHLPRAALALAAAGCRRVGRAAPAYREWRDVYSAAREVPAVMVYWWKYGG